MKKIKGISVSLPWLVAIGLGGALTACGSGGQAPILGAGDVAQTDTLVPVVPPTVPLAVTAVTPLPNAPGVALNTQAITAAFNKPMDVDTLNPGSFTLACPAATPISGGTVTYVVASQIATLTLPANTRLPANAVCHVAVTTAVKDSTGLALASNFAWSFDTGAAPDTTAPTVTQTVSANGASNVPVNIQVGATFSEAMNPLSINNASVTVKQGSTVVPGTTGYSGVSMVFVPVGQWAPNTTYTATISTGATDLAGNAMARDHVWSWTTSPTVAAIDTTPPTVTQTSNANGSANVAVNTKVGVTFSEAMNPLTISNSSFRLQQTLSGTAVPGSTSYSGVSGLFVPTRELTANTRYTATITTMATDLAGNPMANNHSWSWTTALAADNTRPTVTGTTQVNGAGNVAINTKVGVAFSEPLNPLTVTNVNFTLRQTVSGAAVAGTTSYAGTEAVFTPMADLLAATQYTATVKGGVTGVEDQAANAMAADHSWSWTTAAATDTTAPLVTLVNPADMAFQVPVTSAVNATFNEAMDPLTINTATFKVAGVTGEVTFNAVNNVATLTPGTPLAAGTTYTATLTRGVSDLAGNALATDKVWTFSTAATAVVPPTIPLGTAAPFGTFGGTTGMTNTGTLTRVNGDIGTTATGSSMLTGFHDALGDIYTETPANVGAVNGKIFSCTNSTTGPASAGVNAPACAVATQARLDAQAGYLALVAKPVGGASPAPGANLAGITLLPGTYVAPGGSFIIQGGNLTLDAQGDANAIWVFKMATTLTVGGPGAAFPQSIILTGGALAKNVFWQVGSFATINAAGGGTMVGNILSQEGASFSTAGNVNTVTLNGRVLSLGASVTLVNTVINVPQ